MLARVWLLLLSFVIFYLIFKMVTFLSSIVNSFCATLADRNAQGEPVQSSIPQALMDELVGRNDTGQGLVGVHDQVEQQQQQLLNEQAVQDMLAEYGIDQKALQKFDDAEPSIGEEFVPHNLKIHVAGVDITTRALYSGCPADASFPKTMKFSSASQM